MKREEAQQQVREVTEVRDMIANASPTGPYPYRNLVVLRDLLLDEVRRQDHGDRDALFMPSWAVEKGIERLNERYTDMQFASAFKTVRRSLLAIANRYLREMEMGIRELFDAAPAAR